jgi:hypothetical protein
MQSRCHPEEAFLCAAKPGLSEAEGDLAEPRAAACPEQAKRADGSRFCDAIIARSARIRIHFAGPFCPSSGAGGLANFASSTGTFSFTSLT